MEEIVQVLKPEKGSANELKPCPFCGTDEAVYIQYKHIAGLRWKVFCCACTASIDPGYAQNMYQVSEKWNKRA